MEADMASLPEGLAPYCYQVVYVIPIYGRGAGMVQARVWR
jgi:hypothetical protein